MGSCRTVHLASISWGQWCHHMHIYPHLYPSRIEHVSYGCRPLLRWKGQAGIVAAGFNLAVQGKFLLQPLFLTYCSGFVWCLLGWWIFFSQVNFKFTHSPTWNLLRVPKWVRISTVLLGGKILNTNSKLGQKSIGFVFHREIENNYTHS